MRNLSRILLSICTIAALFNASAIGADKSSEKERKKAVVLPSPVVVRRPVDRVLKELGDMIASYTAARGEGPIITEIDYFGNESGSDKLPNDLSQYVRDAIEQIGEIRTFTTFPSGYGSPRVSGGSIPYFVNDRPKHPQATFRLVGTIERSTDALVRQRNGSGAAMFGGGSTQSNGEITGDRNKKITALTIGVTLETPNGLSIPGASARYRIDLEESEKNNSVAFYIAGNGIGLGSRLRITQESADALYDTVAMAIVQVIGNATRVPYHRLSPNFAPDQDLEDRVRDGYSRMTQAELEPHLKRYMLVAGFGLDQRRQELTDLDRAIVLVEMQHRRLDSRDRGGMLELLMQLWRGLDHRAGAKHVAVMLADIDRAGRQAREDEQRQQAEISVSPVEFGWPAPTPIVVLDIRVKDAATQNAVIAAASRCRGCLEIRQHPSKPLLGVRISSRPSEIQFALDTSSLPIDYVWLKAGAPRLLIVPAVAPPQNGAAARSSQ
jgi:hypothetical protein